MKNKAFKQTKPFLNKRWGQKKAEEILQYAERRFTQLCQENESDGKAVKAHTEQDIFPCISLYEALQKNGISSEEALEFLDQSWSKKAQAGADSMRSVLKLFGLYKLYPRMFQWVAKNQFGTAAGFEAQFYDRGKYRCKFDMRKCLFFDTCKRYGCPELTKCFCHVDDINNKDLHPRLCWNRTKYMGGGGDLCDFDIFLTPLKK